MQRRRTRVKICGVTRPQDAADACRHGADAVGIVLHPASARNVSQETARAIVAALSPFVTPVGVFVDAPVQEVLDVAASLGLRTVQLNGAEAPGDVTQLAGLAVIKAIRVTRGGLVAQLEPWRRAVRSGAVPNLVGLVMEPGGTRQPGGTGVSNDWDEVTDAQRAGAFEGLPALIAAGGLRSETVADVVRTVRPWAVDVSSGVEATLGVKAQEKIEAFVAAVRAGDGG
jgi:phosphoribosylanthranilate isomerase